MERLGGAPNYQNVLLLLEKLTGKKGKGKIKRGGGKCNKEREKGGKDGKEK